jgi:hypothetical protein
MLPVVTGPRSGMSGFSLSVSGRQLTTGEGAVILDASGVLKLFG